MLSLTSAFDVVGNVCFELKRPCQQMQCASSKTPVSSETYFMVIFRQHRDEATNNRHFCMPLVLHVYSVSVTCIQLLEPTSYLLSNALELTVGRLVAVLNRRQVRYQCRPRWTTVPCYHSATIPHYHSARPQPKHHHPVAIWGSHSSSVY